MALKIRTFTPKELRAFRIIFHAGPVKRDTTQRKFWNHWRVIRIYLTEEEVSRLITARSHAIFVGEGRGEWDHWSQVIQTRLFGGKTIWHRLLKSGA